MCDRISRIYKLYEDIQKCTRCDLSKLPVNKFRPYPKFGCKPVLIISLAPSYYRREDIDYVWGGLDKAGLIKIFFETVNLNPEDVWITNVLKCSTPKNRSPNKKEVEACKYWLFKEIEIINPDIIICLGRIACDVFRLNDYGVPKQIFLGGKLVTVVGAYHPAYIKRYGLISKYREQLSKVAEVVKRCLS